MELIQTILLALILGVHLHQLKRPTAKIEPHKSIFKPPKPKPNPEVEKISKILNNIETYDGSGRNQQKVR
jgi:hypothetical protein